MKCFQKISPEFFELKGFNEHRHEIELYSKQIF